MAETGRPRATQYAARHIAALGQLIPVQGNRVQITIANQTSMRQCREEGSERCEWLWKEFDDGESLWGRGTQPWVGTPAFPPQPGGSVSGSLKSSDFLSQKFSKLTF